MLATFRNVDFLPHIIYSLLVCFFKCYFPHGRNKRLIVGRNVGPSFTCASETRTLNPGGRDGLSTGGYVLSLTGFGTKRSDKNSEVF